MRSRPAAIWGKPARPAAQVRLAMKRRRGGDPAPAHDLSAAARRGRTLFLAADECAGVEVLQRRGRRFKDHRTADLSKAFKLPDGSDEMDIEGLAIDGRWLWILGSHSLTRKKPRSRRLKPKDLQRLAEIKDNDNRMFLGRVRLKKAGKKRWKLRLKSSGQMLPIGKHGSKLYRKIRKHPLLGPFCDLPAKENGLDIEGIVVAGKRVALGLRGPVIQGYAMVLETKVRARKGELELDGPLKTHVLDLAGLGIRDLKQRGEDMLILAGPTLKLDGPVRVYLWRRWRKPPRKGLLHRPEPLIDLPYGHGCDHPEALVQIRRRGRDALLVVSDAPSPRRLRRGAMAADIFKL
jgi:hypothetical protein